MLNRLLLRDGGVSISIQFEALYLNLIKKIHQCYIFEELICHYNGYIRPKRLVYTITSRTYKIYKNN